MKKISGIALAALLAACGSDPDGRGKGGDGGGSGGSGGSGGDPGITTPIAVENEAGRTFGGEPMTITIEEQAGSGTASVRVDLVTKEIMPDGSDSLGFYELILLTRGDMVISGDLTSTALYIDEPTNPGAGLVRVGFTKGDGEFAGSLDVISLQLDAGTVTGTVDSPKPEVKSSITGEFTITCSFRDGGALVADPDFTSDFCKQFAHQLPAD